MNRTILLVLLILAITISSSQDKHEYNARLYLKNYRLSDKIYREAEKLSLLPGYNEKTEELESRMNRQALEGFRKILPIIEKAGDDSLAFHCWFKIGTLQHYFDSLEAGQRSYSNAIKLKSRLPLLADSFLFKPFLFCGSIYYSMNQFDSALSNYKKAEQIAEKYSSVLNGSNRLYNTLGVLYYETGNYRQAKNYFGKAISILDPGESSYKDLLINYKINLASTLNKLEEFDEANSIYQSILPSNNNKNEILHNTGAVNLSLGHIEKAIEYFKQVQYSNSKRIRLFNDLGFAYTVLKKSDSAQLYFQKALDENQKWNGTNKNTPHGLTLKYLGDELTGKSNYRQAIEKYQQAIIQFDAGFNTTDIFKNPELYSGVFSYINLFNTLTAKADAFKQLYQSQKDIKMLEASLEAYRSAFKLADYVERTYDSDEARLFLGKIKYTAHSKPIDVSLVLFDLTKKRSYLEEAYFFDQRNKASILALNVQENELKNKPGKTNELFSQESSLKSAITRLSLKASQATDSLQLQSINFSIRDYEIQLGKLQDKINADPAYREKQFTENIPSVSELQKRLDHTTALLSYHLSGKELLILFISENRFEYYKLPISDNFFLQIDSFKASLHNVSGEQRYSGTEVARSLYNKLIGPVQTMPSHISRLIIIPDDELNYLPFEALQDENRKYLVEKFSIQYQYSTSLLGKQDHDHIAANMLAFAPFTSNSYNDSTGFTLSSLPASKEEVSNIAGKIFTDSSATKNNFLQTANHYGIIHLATHAIVNNEMPLRSFIAFYPDKNADDYRLYAQEIYNMNLDSTQLVILSACETGTGRLVKGEGLMSLSRAFAYAGCPNIITSLWKAEDKTTAFITRQLHHYLDKGFSKDKALQQAKLDLLNSNEIDPRYKTPNYWAHLLFIGNYEPNHSSTRWWWIAIVIVVATTIYLFLKKKA